MNVDPELTYCLRHLRCWGDCRGLGQFREFEDVMQCLERLSTVFNCDVRSLDLCLSMRSFLCPAWFQRFPHPESVQFSDSVNMTHLPQCSEQGICVWVYSACRKSCHFTHPFIQHLQ